MSSADVATQDFARGFVDNHFNQAVGFAHGEGFAIGSEQSLVGHEIKSLLGTLSLGQAHHCQFWRGEHCTWHYVELYAALFAQDVAQGMETLCRGSMCQHALAVDVTYGEYAGNAGFEVGVGDYAARSDFDAELLNTVGNHWTAANCHEGFFALHRAFFAFGVISYAQRAVGGFSYAFNGCRSNDFDTLAREQTAQALGNVFVERRQDFFAELNHCDFDTKRVEHRGKLHAYHTAAYYAETCRQCLHGQSVVARHAEVGALNGQSLGRGACGYDYAGGCESVGADRYGIFSADFGLAFYHGDLSACQKRCYALTQLLNDALLALESLGVLKLHISCGDAKLRGLAEQIENLGIAAEGLGGYAATVEACAAKLVALNHGDLELVACSLGGHFVATGTCAYYY